MKPKTTILLTATLLVSSCLYAQEFGIALPTKSKDSGISLHLPKSQSQHLKSVSEPDEWISLPVYAGEVTSIASDPNSCSIAYAGTRGAGVFRTLDGGTTWQPARQGLSILPIRKLAVDPVNPAIVYAGSDFDGLWKSTDSCKTWTKTGYPGGMIVFNIAIESTNTSVIYAAEAGGIGLGVGHIYKSVDGGENWMPIENGLPEQSGYTNGIYSLAMHPINPQILCIGTTYKGAYRTTDGGSTWLPFSEGIPSLSEGNYEYLVSVNALSFSPEYPYTPSAILDGNLYKNYGNKWNLIADGYIGTTLDPGELHYYPNDSLKLYTGTHFSEDGGYTWDEYKNNQTNNRIGFASLSGLLTECTSAYGAVAGYSGTAVSIDNAKTWDNSSRGIMGATVKPVAIDHSNPLNMYAGTTENLHYTKDGGMSWNKAYSIIDWGGGYTDTTYRFAYIDDIQIDPRNSEVIYITTFMGMYRSDNGGVSFTQLDGAGSPTFVKMHKESKSGAIYVGGSGVRRSLDKGHTWDSINTGLPEQHGSPINIQCFALDPSDTAKMWVGCWWFEGLYYTVNGGESWTLAGLTNENIVSAVAVHPENPDIIFAGAGFGEYRIYKSTDGGKTWHVKMDGIARPEEFVFDPRGPNQIYVATEGYGILRSINEGETWHSYNNGIYLPMVYSIDITPGDNPLMVAGTYGSGIYSIFPPYYQSQSDKNLLLDYSWSIFPNPTKGYVRIEYSGVNELTNNFSVSIFSVTGSKIDEFYGCSKGMAEVNLSSHQPGLYIFRITYNNRIESRKVVISR